MPPWAIPLNQERGPRKFLTGCPFVEVFEKADIASRVRETLVCWDLHHFLVTTKPIPAENTFSRSSTLRDGTTIKSASKRPSLTAASSSRARRCGDGLRSAPTTFSGTVRTLRLQWLKQKHPQKSRRRTPTGQGLCADSRPEVRLRHQRPRHRRIDFLTGKESIIEGFPSPDELWKRLRA